jgi:hypothetical protein
MNRRTGGIIGTIAAALLCGVPGIILACSGLVAVMGAQSAEIAADNAKWQSTMIGAASFLVGGLVLVLIPIIVGFLTLRRGSSQAPAAPMPAQPAVMTAPAAQVSVTPTPTPVAAARPAPAPQPQAAPAAASPAMAQSAQGGMDGSAQAVYDRIMALNRPSAPYQIVDGKAQNVDLIAEWKIVDAQWYEIFAKASLTKVFRIHMKLDAARREVRAQDQELNVSWKAGVPSLSFEASFFKGQKSSISFGTGYAFTENLAPGQVYKYKFNTNELKKPIQDAVAACGWSYKGVAFGKL